MAYGLLGLLISLGLLAALLLDRQAAYRAKALGTFALLVSLWLGHRLPGAELVGIVAQCLTGIATLLYLRYLAASR